MTSTEAFARLNAAHREAATFGASQPGRGVRAAPLLVIAGACPGKTSTLAHRVAPLLCEGAAPERLLLLTFSRRAAIGRGGRQARLANARIAVAKAELDFKRASDLFANKVETEKTLDDARLQLESAQATVKEIEGAIDLIKTYIDWTVIRSPIDGVVLEKLVDPNELVTPQSFGGTRGPSTALISVADPKDLQVEIDLNETDLSKVSLGQKCKVSPEAYLDRAYEGVVAEIAPEANRQKGTLQLKVQIVKPDKYLTPELTAPLDFIGSPVRPAG